MNFMPMAACDFCRFAGGPDTPWENVRAWSCSHCGDQHRLCAACVRDWSLSWAWSSADTRETLPPLDRCPDSPEIRVMLAVMTGEG